MTKDLVKILMCSLFALGVFLPTRALSKSPPFLRSDFKESVTGRQWTYGTGADAEVFAEIGRSEERISLRSSKGTRIDLYPGHVREHVAGVVWEVWPDDPTWVKESQVTIRIGDTVVIPGFRHANSCLYPKPRLRLDMSGQGGNLYFGGGRARLTMIASDSGSTWTAKSKAVLLGERYENLLSIPAGKMTVTTAVNSIEEDFFAWDSSEDATCGEFWVSLLPEAIDEARLNQLFPEVATQSPEEIKSDSTARFEAYLDQAVERYRALVPEASSSPTPGVTETEELRTLGRWHPAILNRSSRFISLIETANQDELQEILAVTERTFGKASPDAGSARSRLEMKYLSSGELVKEMRLIEEDIATAEGQSAPSMGPFFAIAGHERLAMSWGRMGKFANAEQELRIVLEMMAKNHDDRIDDVRLDLADTIAKQGRFAEAERQFDSVIVELTRRFGTNHEDVKSAMLRRADWRYIRKDCALAEADFVQLRKLAASSPAPDEESVDALDMRISYAQMCQGHNAQAIEAIKLLRGRARDNASLLATREALLDALFRDRRLDEVDSELDSLLVWADGKDVYKPSYTLMKIDSGLLSRRIDTQMQLLISNQIASTLTEFRARSWQLDLDARLQLDSKAIKNATWTFARQAKSPAAAQLAATESLIFKDAVADVSAQSERLSAASQDSDVVRIRRGLRLIASKLSRSVVVPADRREAASLKGEYERLERELADILKSQSKPQDTDVTSIQRAVGNRILVDYRVFRDVGQHPYEWLTNPFDDATPDVQHLAAVVLDGEQVSFVDLGAWAPVLTAITSYRVAIERRDTEVVDKLSRKLHQLVWEPLAELIRPGATVLISPDAELNFLPFSALRGSSGRYLIQDHPIQSVGAARDLLAQPADRKTLGPPIVLYSPAYWRNWPRQAVAGKPQWADLPGVRAEGQEVARLLRRRSQQTEVLTGSDANETAIRGAKSPAYLHIATHGYFLEEPTHALVRVRNAYVAPIASTVSKPTATTPEGTIFHSLPAASAAFRMDSNPLLRSGLVLAGANDTLAGILTRGDDVDANADDGLLTALEVQSLDLAGTELVVLSACETGVGEFRSGAGVASLQRAFLAAGANAVIYSLWDVDDAATRDLMTRLYTEVKKGVDPSDALRSAQLGQLNESEYKAPWMWAAFTGTPSVRRAVVAGHTH